jgi:uncharacterized protein (DUF1786 family)
VLMVLPAFTIYTVAAVLAYSGCNLFPLQIESSHLRSSEVKVESFTMLQEEIQLLASRSRDGSMQVVFDSSSGEIMACLLQPNSMRDLLIDPLCSSTLTSCWS